MAAVRHYRPALDGIRALAILGVMSQHAGVTWVHSGGLGVTVFFVLSGYLITGLLTAERESSGRVDLPAFYLRRVLRLYPALLLALVAGSIVYATDLGHSDHDVTISALVAAGYLTDLFTFDHPSWLQIWGVTWSLSVEEHFYLLWPAALVLVRTRRAAQVVALAGVVVGAVIVETHTNSAAAAFEPQTFVASLLLGCLLALLPPLDRRWRLAGLPALAGVIAILVSIDSWPYPDFYRWGIPLTSLATGLLLISLESDGPAAALLGLPPLRWLGEISYGVYLYHLVIFAEIDKHLSAGHNETVVVQMLAAIGFAAVSYYAFERPVRAAGRRRLSRRRASSEPAAPSR
jgi:peptidoglycan/LPS O-acetylase OafA/YrhL